MRRAVVLSCLAFSVAATSAAEAGREQEVVLHDFTGASGEGTAPGGLTVDRSTGTFYGISGLGGPANAGTIWSYGADGTLSVLHQFQGAPSDGGEPARPVLGPDGALYGVTVFGGKFNQGTIYRVARTGSGWTEKVLHSFCQDRTGPCRDGAVPTGALAVAKDGTLFGTTLNGGDGFSANEGTLFRLEPPTGGKAWKFRVLHSFCSEAGCTDGEAPAPNLLLTGRGKIYGTAQAIGITGMTGAIYSVNSDGRHYRVLHTFSNRTGDDGYSPANGLARDSHGVLYGTTVFDVQKRCGTVYSFDPASTAYQTLYRFCSHRDDVLNPYNVPILAENRDGLTIYGSSEGGKYGEGGVYRIRAPAILDGKWTERVIYSFCAVSGCPDGTSEGGEVVHYQGAIYGTAEGGVTQGGLFYRLSDQP
jgi:uncharacterized repeat protein (TIGR03803 family)